MLSARAPRLIEEPASPRPMPEGHDRTSLEAAMRLTGETDTLTTGVLYTIRKPTLGEELAGIGGKALPFDAMPPSRDAVLRAFA